MDFFSPASLCAGKLGVGGVYGHGDAVAEATLRRILRKSSSCPRLALRGGQEGGEDDGGSPDGYQGSTDPITQLGKGGHINQIEYALKAVQKGLTVIAMKVFQPSPLRASWLHRSRFGKTFLAGRRSCTLHPDREHSGIIRTYCLQGEHTCCVVVERRALPPLQVSTSARKIYQVSNKAASCIQPHIDVSPPPHLPTLHSLES